MAKKTKTIKRRVTNVTKEKSFTSQQDRQKFLQPTERNMRGYRVRVECSKCFRQAFRIVENYKSPKSGDKIPGRCTQKCDVKSLTVVTVFGIVV